MFETLLILPQMTESDLQNLTFHIIVTGWPVISFEITQIKR